MKGTMKVAVMNGIGQMGYTNRDIPQPKDNEVLVKLEYVGICGSDMHYYETGRIGDYVVEPPFVLGHEPGGTVVEVGKNVKHLKVGDRVALEPGPPRGPPAPRRESGCSGSCGTWKNLRTVRVLS